jgi:RNA polymerase sigma-70 factor (ECF subfamily)
MLRAYGPEILGFLIARVGDEDEAAEVFGEFSLDLWRGLGAFAWRCSARVWAFTLARHAAVRHALAPHRRRARNIPLSELSVVSAVAAEVRSQTSLHRRSDLKRQVRRLREGLPLEEQELLILRVDKRLSWRDLARVMVFAARDPSDEELARAAARLRKRFELVKEKLRTAALQAGLLASHDGDRSAR